MFRAGCINTIWLRKKYPSGAKALDFIGSLRHPSTSLRAGFEAAPFQSPIMQPVLGIRASADKVSTDAVHERVLDILIAEFLTAKAHSVCVLRGTKDATQSLYKRLVHRTPKNCRPLAI
jgi:hypothetical protein